MRVVVIGAGGIGTALATEASKLPGVTSVCLTSRTPRSRTNADPANPKIENRVLDPTSDADVQRFAAEIGEIDWLLNCTGMLHTEQQGPEKTISATQPDFLMQNMQVNCLPTMLLAKHLRNNFNHGRAAVFATISARVGSISDNRLGGWYSYRASKAALNMIIKSLSIEWKRVLPAVTVAALHPGTVATSLSEPFQSGVPSQKLFSPEQSAGYLLNVIAGLKPEQSGQFWAWDGTQIEW